MSNDITITLHMRNREQAERVMEFIGDGLPPFDENAVVVAGLHNETEELGHGEPQ